MQTTALSLAVFATTVLVLSNRAARIATALSADNAPLHSFVWRAVVAALASLLCSVVAVAVLSVEIGQYLQVFW